MFNEVKQLGKLYWTSPLVRFSMALYGLFWILYGLYVLFTFLF